MDLFADDIEWVQPGESVIGGTFRGKAEVMEHLGRLAQKSLTVKVNGLVAEGDTVVALTEVSVGGETGQDADVFTVRDGKTVRVRRCTETPQCWNVFSAKGSSVPIEAEPDPAPSGPLPASVSSWACGFLA